MVTAQPRKSRKLLYSLPNHLARRQVSSHLSDELIKKYDRRTMTLRKGDTVRVLRGDFRGTVGKVLAVDIAARKVQVDGVTVDKADKTKKPRPIDPSNLEITKLDLSDKLRREKIGETQAPAPEPNAEPEEADEATEGAQNDEEDEEEKPKPKARKARGKGKKEESE